VLTAAGLALDPPAWPLPHRVLNARQDAEGVAARRLCVVAQAGIDRRAW
jgi:hypothetical protein